MPLDALAAFLVPINTIVEQPVEREPPKTWVKCTRANCTSPRFAQRADPDDTTCVACTKRDAEYNHSKAAKKAKGRYRDTNREALIKKGTERKEERRNDPELHAHDQQVAAEYRANNVESIAEYNAAYRAEHQEERKEYNAEYYKEHKEQYAERKAERRADPMKHAHDLEVAADRREERRNDPELHAHDQQVAAEYRADNAGHIAEVSAEYRANNAEKIKDDMDAWNKSASAKECKATYRDANREELNEKSLDRKEQRRNDPELHAHDQQVSAEYRADNAGHIAEVSATYRAEHQEERKEYMDAWNKSDAAKECKAAYKLTDKGVASEERYRRSAAKRASRLRERQNGKKLASNARYRAKHREELKVKQDAWNHSPMGLLTRALYKMVKGVHWDPQSFTKLGSFASNEEAMAHFEERFDPSWMSWENQGRHVKGNAYKATWNIGHALPRKIFDQSDEEDLRRCWSPDNLFPQCARQNTELRDALIYTDDELLEMRHLWPVGAKDDLAQLKGLFQFVDHDFIRSKQAAEAGPSGLNGGFVSDDASSASG